MQDMSPARAPFVFADVRVRVKASGVKLQQVAPSAALHASTAHLLITAVI